MLLICAASNGKNLKLAHTLQGMAESLGIHAEALDLTATDLPLYSPRTKAQGVPEGFAPLCARFEAATAYIFCAPEYNGTIPPTMTNAIAWLSTSSDDFRSLFNGRPTAIATHSGGAGAKVLIAMRLHLSHLGANVLGREIMTNRNKALSQPAAESILTQLKALMPEPGAAQP